MSETKTVTVTETVVGRIAFNPFTQARKEVLINREFLRKNPLSFFPTEPKPKASKETTTTNELEDSSHQSEAETQERTKFCVKCKSTKLRNKFGKHESSRDGLQSYCLQCRNDLQKRRRLEDPVYRLRHHISARVGSQIKKKPKGYVADLEKYLGYTFKELSHYLEEELRSREGSKRSIMDAFNEGYHVDHILPLSSFGDLDIDSHGFRICWEMANLRTIPAEENLEKGSKISATGT